MDDSKTFEDLYGSELVVALRNFAGRPAIWVTATVALYTGTMHYALDAATARALAAQLLELADESDLRAAENEAAAVPMVCTNCRKPVERLYETIDSSIWCHVSPADQEACGLTAEAVKARVGA